MAGRGKRGNPSLQKAHVLFADTSNEGWQLWGVGSAGSCVRQGQVFLHVAGSGTFVVSYFCLLSYIPVGNALVGLHKWSPIVFSARLIIFPLPSSFFFLPHTTSLFTVRHAPRLSGKTTCLSTVRSNAEGTEQENQLCGEIPSAWVSPSSGCVKLNPSIYYLRKSHVSPLTFPYLCPGCSSGMCFLWGYAKLKRMFLNFFGTLVFSFPLLSEMSPALQCCQQNYLVWILLSLNTSNQRWDKFLFFPSQVKRACLAFILTPHCLNL